jgi:RHS repeat-associated protein
LGYDFLDRVEATSPDATLAHDSLGNLTQYGDTTLTYEQTNQLISASNGTTTITFDRTPDGNLFQKTTSTSNSDTSIRYAAGGLILDDSGTPTSQTLVIGTLVATLDLSTPDDTDYTVTTLQYGNALLQLDATGAAQNLANPILYSPWGQAINPPAAEPTQPLYGWQATNLLETNLDLVLMGERTYLTSLGRFTSLDPVFGRNVNSYNYAANDPINNNDPNGRQSQIVDNYFTTKNLTYAGIGVGSVVGVGIVGAIVYKVFKTPVAEPDPSPELNVGPSNVEGTAEGANALEDPNIAGNEINALGEGRNNPALEVGDGAYEGIDEGNLLDEAVVEALGAGGLL